MSRHGIGTAGVLALVAGLAFVGGRLSTSYEGNTALALQPEGEAAFEMPGATLAPEHETLKAMLGDWEGSVKFKMGEEWMESGGTIHRELAMDGRYVIEHVVGEMPEGEFHGMGIVGYNTIDKTYESVWIENMATNMMFATGSYDKAAKKFKFKGKMIDPMTGDKVDSISYLDVSDPNKETFEGYAIKKDGTKEKNFEGSFTRK
jgi:hypothetical protein